MPTYLFKCPDCDHHFEAVFRMVEKKEAKCPKCKKLAERIFCVPNTVIDGKVSAWDVESLVKKTGKMKGTVGDLWDMAAEASDKRGGISDPVRKKAMVDYERKRNGKKYRYKEDLSIGVKDV